MANETNNQQQTPTPVKPNEEKVKLEKIKKQKAKAETARFKSKYFEYYDDIKISDRQDW